MRSGFWPLIILLLLGLCALSWFIANVIRQPNCTLTAKNKGFFRKCASSDECCEELEPGLIGCDGNSIDQNCYDRIEFMKQNYKNGQYDDVKFPANPTNDHFQKFLADCEGQCPPCSQLTWKPQRANCKGKEEEPEHPACKDGTEFDSKVLRILSWNTQAYCSQIDNNWKDIQAALSKADCSKTQPLDIFGVQESGDHGQNRMTDITRNLRYMAFYEPGNGISIAWNKKRFLGTSIRGKLRVAGPEARFLVYIVLEEMASKKRFLVVNYHGCINCPEEAQDNVINQFRSLTTAQNGCSGPVIPVFLCDCQGAFESYRTRFEQMLRSCWGSFSRIQASPGSKSNCGFIDFIYWPTNKLELIEHERSFGSTYCGCSTSGCTDCRGLKDSDHASVLGLFRIK